MLPGYREFEQTKNGKIMPATFKRGIISKINFQQGIADVIIVGNIQTVLKNIQLSSAVPSTAKVGDKCRIDMFDETNPNDIVVAYTYGGVNSGKTASGVTPQTFSAVPTGVTPGSIPHGLGMVPAVFDVYPYDNQVSPNRVYAIDVVVTSVDDKLINFNFYVQSGATYSSAQIQWWASTV